MFHLFLANIEEKKNPANFLLNTLERWAEVRVRSVCGISSNVWKKQRKRQNASILLFWWQLVLFKGFIAPLTWTVSSFSAARLKKNKNRKKKKNSNGILMGLFGGEATEGLLFLRVGGAKSKQWKSSTGSPTWASLRWHAGCNYPPELKRTTTESDAADSQILAPSWKLQKWALIMYELKTGFYIFMTGVRGGGQCLAAFADPLWGGGCACWLSHPCRLPSDRGDSWSTEAPRTPARQACPGPSPSEAFPTRSSR